MALLPAKQQSNYWNTIPSKITPFNRGNIHTEYHQIWPNQLLSSNQIIGTRFHLKLRLSTEATFFSSKVMKIEQSRLAFCLTSEYCNKILLSVLAL